MYLHTCTLSAALLAGSADSGSPAADGGDASQLLSGSGAPDASAAPPAPITKKVLMLVSSAACQNDVAWSCLFSVLPVLRQRAAKHKVAASLTHMRAACVPMTNNVKHKMKTNVGGHQARTSSKAALPEPEVLTFDRLVLDAATTAGAAGFAVEHKLAAGCLLATVMVRQMDVRLCCLDRAVANSACWQAWSHCAYCIWFQGSLADAGFPVAAAA